MVNSKGFNPNTGEWNDSLIGDFIWSSANIGEALAIVMTPFTWSVIGAAYDEFNVLPGYHTAGNIGGRAYQNGSVMYAALKAAGKNPDDLTSELGGSDQLPQGLTIPEIPLPRLAFFPILLKGIRFQMKERGGCRNLPQFLTENPKWCRVMRQRIGAAQTQEEAVRLWDEIIPYTNESMWRMASTAFRYAETISPLRSELTTLVGDEDTHALLSSVSTDSQLLASLGPVVGLAKVARGQMKPQAYLEQYGHRGPYETEISAPRPAEDPTWLDRQLATLDESAVDVDALLAERRAEFETAWGKFQDHYPGKAKEVKRRLDEAAYAARMREAVRSETTRIVWVLRDWALRAGELTNLGDDIFYLISDEVMDLLDGKDAPTECIPARRATYHRYSHLPPYPTIISGQFDPFRWAADPNHRSDFYDSHVPRSPSVASSIPSKIITGAAGSAGHVEGLVRRLDSPEEGNQLLQGEILVTSQTNIGWTPLFPRAAALITDVGGPLSHAAIVARELGIPAVVGCGDATNRLKTGDRVRVDGARGILEILA